MGGEKKIRLFIGATGGSGAGYLLRMLERLRQVEGDTDFAASPTFGEVLRTEFEGAPKNIDAAELAKFGAAYFKSDAPQNGPHKFRTFGEKDFSAPAASGSAEFDATIILPCSMKTLSSVASGSAANLIERGADVALKERRKLILVIRETPYNLVHIENMKRATLAGATILPASPGFYHRPQTIVDIYDFIVDRIFQHAGVAHRKIGSWGEP